MPRLTLACAGFALLLAALPSHGQELEPSRSLFFDVGVVHFDIDGDFDDSLLLLSQTEVYNLPSIVESVGIQFAIGGLFAHGGASLFYLRASPKTTSILGNQDSRFRLYGVDVYYLPFEKYQRDPVITPLFRGAFSLATLGIDDSASDGVDVADAHFRGFGLTGGVGALVRVGGRVNITAEIDRRLTAFGSVQGTGDRQSIGESLTAITNFIRVSVTTLF